MLLVRPFKFKFKFKFRLKPIFLALLGLFLVFILVGLVGLVFQKQRLELWLNSFILESVAESLPEGFEMQSVELGWTLRSILFHRRVHLKAVMQSPYGPWYLRGPVWAERKLWQLHLQPELLWLRGESDADESKVPMARFEGQLTLTYSPELRQLYSVELKAQSEELSLSDHRLSGVDLELSILRNHPAGEPNTVLGEMAVDLTLSWEKLQAQFGAQQLTTGKANLFAHLEACELRIQLSELNFQTMGSQGSVAGQISWNGQWPEVCVLSPSPSPSLNLNFNSGFEGQGQFRLNDLMFESIEGDRALALSSLDSQWSLSEGAEEELQLAMEFLPKQLEVLWGDIYASPPIEAYRLRTQMNFFWGETLDFSTFAMSLDPLSEGGNSLMTFGLKPNEGERLQGFWGEWSWQSELGELFELVPVFSTGHWQTEARLNAQLKFVWSERGLIWRHPSFVEIRKIQLKNPKLRHLSDGGEVALRTVKDQGSPQEVLPLQGSFNWPKLRQHNLQGTMGPWSFPIQVDFKNNQLHLSSSELPLAFEGLFLELSPLEGIFKLEDSLIYELNMGFQLAPMELKQLTHLLCIDPELIPQASLSLRYPKVTVAHNRVVAQGEGRLDLFNGQALVSDILVEDLLSVSPKTRTSVVWQDLDLSAIGDFTNFGGMVGRLNGHLKDLVFTGALLTDYNFNFRLVPLDGRSKFYFSRRATENLVDIFARGQGVSEGLVGALLRWSGRIFGDYGISYAGVQARTHGQFVILETFDPAEVVAREQSRFLLYGQRIKMPLSTKTYPLILSQSGWAGFITYFKESLIQLMDREDENQESIKDCFAL